VRRGGTPCFSEQPPGYRDRRNGLTSCATQTPRWRAAKESLCLQRKHERRYHPAREQDTLTAWPCWKVDSAPSNSHDVIKYPEKPIIMSKNAEFAVKQCPRHPDVPKGIIDFSDRSIAEASVRSRNAVANSPIGVRVVLLAYFFGIFVQRGAMLLIFANSGTPFFVN